MSRSGRLAAAALLSAAGVLGARSAQATHVMAMSMRYRVPDPAGAPTTVEVTLDLGYRGDFPQSPDVGILFEGGPVAHPPPVVVSSVGLATPSPFGYRVARYTATYAFPAGGPQAASSGDCCLASSLLNGHDGPYNARTIMGLAPGVTGSALASVPPVVHLQTGGLRQYKIATRDPDGAPVTCRWAAQDELLFASAPPAIPGGAAATISSDPDGCVFSWDTTGAMDGDTYAVGLALETVKGGLKSVTVEAFSLVLSAAPPPTCTGNGLFQADLGVELQLPFLGTSAAPGALTLGAISLFGGMTPSLDSQAASPFPATLKLTPFPGDEGLHAMSVVYKDPAGHMGDCGVLVNVAACPPFGTPCQAGVGACAANGDLYCKAGQVLCTAVPGAPSLEICDAIDNDCDGVVDNDCSATGAGGQAGSGAGGQAGSGQGGQATSGAGGQAGSGAGGQATSGVGGQAGSGQGGSGGATSGTGGAGASSGGQAGSAGSSGSTGSGAAQGGASVGSGAQGGAGAGGNAAAGGQTTGGNGSGGNDGVAGCTCETQHGSGNGGAIAGLVALSLAWRRRRGRRAAPLLTSPPAP